MVALSARMKADGPHYKWVALSNTTLGMLMATINSSIILISLPGIFRGIGIDPLSPGNVGYLLWLMMGYMLVTAVLVVTLGRLGDIMGRVRIYNAGFAVFSFASIVLALDPMHGGGGAMWLVLWRLLQGVGGAMLFANSSAIIVDAVWNNVTPDNTWDDFSVPYPPSATVGPTPASSSWLADTAPPANPRFSRSVHE